MRNEVMTIQRGILDATQTSAKAASYQNEQLTYQSELLDNMVTAIRSLQRALVSGIKMGANVQTPNTPRPVNRGAQTNAPEQLTKVKTADGKVIWKNAKGQFASKAAAEQKERDDQIISIFTGVELAVSYMNEKITEQTELLDSMVRSNRSMSSFLKTFVRRVSEDKKTANAEQEAKGLEDESEENNERRTKGERADYGSRRDRKSSGWESILDGFAGVLKGLLIPLMLGFGDGLDKSLGWIGKLTDGFKTLCGWIGDAITGFNNWFSGNGNNPGIFNKWMDHVHDVFQALADFDPRDVIKKILTALPESVQKVIPDALLQYAHMGKFSQQEETISQTVDRKNRENVVGVKFEQKFDKDQQKQWDEIGQRIKKQGHATEADKAALNKIVGDSRGFLGNTFGSDKDQTRYVDTYATQMTLRGKYAQQNNNAVAATGIDTDALWKKLAPEIAKGESDGAGGYEAHHGPAIPGLTKMTLDQVSKLTGAVGKYQFLPKTTLLEAAMMAGLKPSDTFSPENQEKMGRALFDRRVKQGAKGGVAGIQKQLSMEWASLPKDASGAGYYDGDKAGNRASGGAVRAASISDAIASSVSNPPMVAPSPSQSGAKLTDAVTPSKAATIVTPVAAVSAPVTNVTNNQTVNQPVQSATTPAEFRSHV